MTLVAFQGKVKRWQKSMPGSINKAMRKLLTSIKKEAREAYSGAVVGVHSGKTRNAISYSYKSKSMSAKVFVKKARWFISYFHEHGTKHMRPRPVWGPLKKKYTPITANKMLDEIMESYKRSGK